MKDTAVLVTTYTGGKGPELKRHMTKTICKSLQEQGNYVLLASHSTIDEETQSYCNHFIYDADNSFKLNGHPNRDWYHPVAEFKSMHDAVAIFKRMGFKNFLKVTYDIDPNVNYAEIIEKCKQTGMKAVTARWHNVLTTMGTMLFFTEIEFFEKTFGLQEVYKFDRNIEDMWFESAAQKNLIHEVMILPTYEDFFGHNIKSYAGQYEEGTRFLDYPY